MEGFAKLCFQVCGSGYRWSNSRLQIQSSMIETPVKVSGINSLTDARYCAGMGVQYLGIQFNDLTKTLSPLEFKSIRAWIEGIEWVGEYGGNSAEELKKLAAEYELQFWEIGQISLAAELKNEGFRLGFKLENPTDVIPDHRLFEYLSMPWSVKDSATSSAGLIGFQTTEIPILFSGISSIADLRRAMEQYPGYGFHFQSGEEERPGWMDLSALQDMLEVLEDLLKP